MLAGLLRRTIRCLIPRTPDGDIAAVQAVLASREFTPETILSAAMQGFFAMRDCHGRINWHCPDRRAVIPVDGFHVRKSLQRVVRNGGFEIRINSAFDDVVTACADRPDAWITPPMIDVYRQLHGMGIAKSVEAWQDGQLAGGVYGLSLGRCFISESQFHRVDHAGKVAFVALFEVLRANGYLLHDVQYATEFLTQFGAVELDRREYQSRLTRALLNPAAFELPSHVIERVVTGASRNAGHAIGNDAPLARV